MIDLACTREQMLADIGATEGTPHVSDLADPAAHAAFVTREEARHATRVHTPQPLLASLERVLAERFAAVPGERLERDLLAPLKKALGNAYKRGNLMDGDKWITVEVVVTRAGAFLQVSDEGAGFDVAATCARFAAGARYFAHHGSGFRKFHKAGAVVAFADGGRTCRACFRVAALAGVRPAAH